jgi:hypothetical protein
MYIKCINGTPIVDTLDHLPPLPLQVDYSSTKAVMEQDEVAICHALRSHNRVHHIYLQLSLSTLHKCLAIMDGHYPILEHLFLLFPADQATTLTLPKAFLAPNLRYLALFGVGLPKRLRALTSAVSLIRLELGNIQTSNYFPPRLLVARLSSLPHLKELSMSFSIPIPRPSTEGELLGKQGACVTLPSLKKLQFKGVSAYLENFVAQIRAPLLERLGITLFNQIAFALPHLSNLINITAFKLPAVWIYFDRDEVSVTTSHHSSTWSDGFFLLRVMCKQLDWQIDCAAQICNALVPGALSGAEHFTLDYYDSNIPTELQNDAIDGATWHELLRPFIGVKELYIYNGLLEELSRALQVEVGSELGFLPNLRSITAANNLFTTFIDTRRLVGLPVEFSRR